jgi:hypothetical protein
MTAVAVSVMLVWHFSDLHLDVSPQWQLPPRRPTFDVVVVAGDLITRAERGVKWLLENVPNKQVVYCSGITKPMVRTLIVL